MTCSSIYTPRIASILKPKSPTKILLFSINMRLNSFLCIIIKFETFVFNWVFLFLIHLYEQLSNLCAFLIDFFLTIQILNCRFNPILHGGGPLWPGQPKIVCRFHMDCAALTKFLDFVSFIVLQVSEESFSEKKNFCKKYRTSSKISKGGTLLCKNQNFQKKNTFFWKTLFFLLEYELYMISAFF